MRVGVLGGGGRTTTPFRGAFVDRRDRRKTPFTNVSPPYAHSRVSWRGEAAGLRRC